MKKVFLALALIIGTSVFAVDESINTLEQTGVINSPNTSQKEASAEAETTTEEVQEDPPIVFDQPLKPKQLEFPDYTVVNKQNENFYYDKTGNFFAHDKKINDTVFFYNKNGQFLGKSQKQNEKTFYFNPLGKYMGYCNDDGCYDKDSKSTMNVPPLPVVKKFVPVYDPNIINPSVTSL